jgi:DtxR family Mn-dependent transcriptional regulator
MPEPENTENAGIPKLTSESEEMYLITVARAVEQGHADPIPVALIARELGLSVASANEMVRKLARRCLMEYEPYRGARLTESGRAVAARVLRTRRLWSTFLATRLGLSPTSADDQACSLEHVTAPATVDRLAAHLGSPNVDPMGRRIPPSSGGGAWKAIAGLPLDEAPVGDAVEVVAINAAPAAVAYLADQGVTTGARVTLVGIGPSSLLLNAAGLVDVDRRIAHVIEVQIVGVGDAG